METHTLPLYDETCCTLFALGRNAMYAACQAAGLRAGDEVLTPAFDCDGSLQPFTVLGCTMRFFRSDPLTFSADLDDLRRRITPNTKLIHLINHFGMPQPWDELLALRAQAGIPILEDNAYSLFSAYHGRAFGTFGDVAVFSLRKNLPLLDGGLLRINNPAYRAARFPQRAARWVHPTERGGVAAALKASLGYYRTPEVVQRTLRAWRRIEAPPPPLYSEEAEGYPAWPQRDVLGREFTCDYLRPMSRFAQGQLRRLSSEECRGVMDAKRRHYAWLVERLQRLPGVRVLWPVLPEGVVPFCVSMLVAQGRDRLLRALQERYRVMAWPTLPAAVLGQLDQFPDVKVLGRQLLQVVLPADRVRHARYAAHLEGLVEDLTRLVNESTSGAG